MSYSAELDARARQSLGTSDDAIYGMVEAVIGERHGGGTSSPMSGVAPGYSASAWALALLGAMVWTRCGTRGFPPTWNLLPTIWTAPGCRFPTDARMSWSRWKPLSIWKIRGRLPAS